MGLSCRGSPCGCPDRRQAMTVIELRSIRAGTSPPRAQHLSCHRTYSQTQLKTALGNLRFMLCPLANLDHSIKELVVFLRSMHNQNEGPLFCPFEDEINGSVSALRV